MVLVVLGILYKAIQGGLGGLGGLGLFSWTHRIVVAGATYTSAAWAHCSGFAQVPLPSAHLGKF